MFGSVEDERTARGSDRAERHNQREGAVVCGEHFSFVDCAAHERERCVRDATLRMRERNK
jgi:hypothetical protein